MDSRFEQMTPAERIEYLQDLWDRVAAAPQDVPITEAQRAELRRRLYDLSARVYAQKHDSQRRW